MSHGMNIFHRAVRHQQTMFMVEILSLARGAIDGLLHGSAIFRMGALDDKFHGRLRRPVTSKYSESLVRPDNLSACDIPSKAASAAQSLRFGQIHFAVQERGFNSLLSLHRYLQVMARTLKILCCFPLRRDQECNNERCKGKQEQTRQLRNTHREQVMLPGKRIDWRHQVIMKGQKGERQRQ